MHASFSKRIAALAFMLLALLWQPALGDEPFQTVNPEAENGGKVVKVGLFITNLYDIDLSSNQYNVQYWLWFLHGHEDYEPLKRTEVVNAKSQSSRSGYRSEVENVYWDSVNHRAVINQEWDVSHYPFDRQVLSIQLEDIEETTENLRYVADVEGSRMAEGIVPDGWELTDFSVSSSSTRYQTAFGDPQVSHNSESEFSRITARITLKRDGWRLFATTFLGFFVATVLCLLVFLINMLPRAHSAIPLQPRITMTLGSLFAAVGSIYGIADTLPYTTAFTLADSLQYTTLGGAALATIGSVTADVLAKQEKMALLATLGKVFFAIYLVFHVVLNATLLTYSALS